MDCSGIYERYAPDVHRFALYLSGNFAVAEDLTSETFVHAFCGHSELRVDTVKAYLFAIARNLYRDSLRRSDRQVAIGDLPEHSDQAPATDRTLEGREALSEVLIAMGKLPELQREALVLSVDRDMTHGQIALILGCSVAAVKVRIHRARMQLRMEVGKTWKT